MVLAALRGYGDTTFGTAIEVIDEANPPIRAPKKYRQRFGGDIYQSLAELMYETLLAAARVEGPKMFMWHIQHNIVWTGVFERMGEKSAALAIVQTRVVRLLYDQIKRMDDIGPNYVGVKVVGLVLNILGLKPPSRQTYLPCERSIYHFAEQWAKKNYLQLRAEYPDVADAMLVGSLSYSKNSQRLRKTYAGWLGKQGTRQYLDLEKPGKNKTVDDTS